LPLLHPGKVEQCENTDPSNLIGTIPLSEEDLQAQFDFWNEECSEVDGPDAPDADQPEVPPIVPNL